MTKRVTKTAILQRLAVRFGLEDKEGEEGAQFLLPRRLFMVTNVDSLLRRVGLRLGSAVSITGTGDYTVLTVPAGKRWILYALTVSVVSGVWTWDQAILIPRNLADGTHVEGFGIAPIVAGAGGATKRLENPWPAEEGDYLVVHIDGYTSTGNLQARALVEEEDAF